MKVVTDRIIAIISCMYGQNAELVVNLSDEVCYLFCNGMAQDLYIYDEEVDCLIYNDIIELDSGCDEDGHETMSYVLTEIAQDRMREIVKNKEKRSYIS